MESESTPALSIVIPTLDEALYLPRLLTDLEHLEVDNEVIVVDGGSRDDTVGLATRAGARVIATTAGRGIQLAAGADTATASLLCFLHADVRLNIEAVRALDRMARDRPVGVFAFRLRIADGGRTYRLIERGADLRSRWLRLPYGDQGLVVRREDYDAAGGYPSFPLMEDVTLVRALRKVTTMELLSEYVEVSSRRWRRVGPMRRSAANLILLVRYLAGSPPGVLATRYRAENADE